MINIEMLLTLIMYIILIPVCIILIFRYDIFGKFIEIFENEEQRRETKKNMEQYKKNARYGGIIIFLYLLFKTIGILYTR